MNQAPLGEVAALLSRSVESRQVPGAVVLAGSPATAPRQWVCGQADAITPRPLDGGTLFDLASLTKVVSTTPLVLRLIAAGAIAVGQRVQTILPGALAGTPSTATVGDLLSHTSGLPATIDLEAERAAGLPWREAVLAAAPVAAPGVRVVYSDIGFLLLGLVVEEITGKSLPSAFSELVAAPLELGATRFGPVPAELTAATEPDASGIPLCGTVHDENTRLIGGAAGHAGLFSTAGDLGRFAQWWLSADDALIPAGLRRESERCRTAGAGGCRGLGWVCRGDRFDFLQGWPQGAVSHSGFTGTSIALDAASGSWVVALTNAVHYGRAKEGIRNLRRELHFALRPS